MRFAPLTVEAFATVRQWRHDDAFARISSDSPCVVANNATTFDFPVASVKVQVGAADAACAEFDEDFSAFNFRIGNILDPDVFWSMVDGCLQKISAPRC